MLCKPYSMRVAEHRFLGSFERLVWQGLLLLVVLGHNRSVRFRHAAVGLFGLGKLWQGGTTQAVVFLVGVTLFCVSPFFIGGFCYVSGKLLLF